MARDARARLARRDWTFDGRALAPLPARARPQRRLPPLVLARDLPDTPRVLWIDDHAFRVLFVAENGLPLVDAGLPGLAAPAAARNRDLPGGRPRRWVDRQFGGASVGSQFQLFPDRRRVLTAVLPAHPVDRPCSIGDLRDLRHQIEIRPNREPGRVRRLRSAPRHRWRRPSLVRAASRGASLEADVLRSDWRRGADLRASPARPRCGSPGSSTTARSRWRGTPTGTSFRTFRRSVGRWSPLDPARAVAARWAPTWGFPPGPREPSRGSSSEIRRASRPHSHRHARRDARRRSIRAFALVYGALAIRTDRSSQEAPSR